MLDRGLYAGQDVFVIGSGASLDYMPAGFFDGRITVAANAGCLALGIVPTYFVTKYHATARELDAMGLHVPVVVTRFDCGNHNSARMGDDSPFIVLDHPHNTCEAWSVGDWPGEGEFVASWSTITTAMHWAAHIGAGTMFLVGHDCGTFDGAARVDGYYDRGERDIDAQMFPHFDRQSRVVKAELRERYGCEIVSLLPFINANMEGRSFRSFAGGMN